MYHKEILNDIEFIIIDNNPTGDDSKRIQQFIASVSEPIQYIPFSEYKSVIVRNEIFKHANTPYVLSIDSHVLIEPHAIKQLINFYDSGKDYGNLLHGPIIYDDMIRIYSSLDLKWNNYIWGKWNREGKGLNPAGEPFEIQAMSVSLFSCRKDSWLGFHDKIRGWGGEEGHIHEMYRKYGRKVICLPFLRYLHRTIYENEPTYSKSLVDRFKNYIIGFIDLGLDTDPIFKEYITAISLKDMIRIKADTLLEIK